MQTNDQFYNIKQKTRCFKNQSLLIAYLRYALIFVHLVFSHILYVSICFYTFLYISMFLYVFVVAHYLFLKTFSFQSFCNFADIILAFYFYKSFISSNRWDNSNSSFSCLLFLMVTIPISSRVVSI